jgi:hypothetical protein
MNSESVPDILRIGLGSSFLGSSFLGSSFDPRGAGAL